jgi:hypothetical protein
MANFLKTMGFDAVPQGLKGHAQEIYDDIWPSAKKYLFENNKDGSVTLADLENLRIPLLRFLTFSFHHSLLLDDADTTASILISCTNQRALVTMPKDTDLTDEILLAVPVALAGPSYTSIKRLWYLRKVERSPGELYEVIAKTYIWGCDTIIEQEGYVRLERNVSIVR